MSEGLDNLYPKRLIQFKKMKITQEYDVDCLLG